MPRLKFQRTSSLHGHDFVPLYGYSQLTNSLRGVMHMLDKRPHTLIINSSLEEGKGRASSPHFPSVNQRLKIRRHGVCRANKGTYICTSTRNHHRSLNLQIPFGVNKSGTSRARRGERRFWPKRAQRVHLTRCVLACATLFRRLDFPRPRAPRQIIVGARVREFFSRPSSTAL